MIGAELGYRYVDSCRASGSTTAHRCRIASPTAIRSFRLDRSKADLSGLEHAIRSHGAPVTVLSVPDRIARDIYGYDLILPRPDRRVVWRGRAAPEDATEAAAIATGQISANT